MIQKRGNGSALSRVPSRIRRSPLTVVVPENTLHSLLCHDRSCTCPPPPPTVPTTTTTYIRTALDALGAPASVGLAHVGGGFNRRDKLEDNVDDADDADNRTRDDPPIWVPEDQAAEEDVN
jgi:hypothetical protein